MQLLRRKQFLFFVVGFIINGRLTQFNLQLKVIDQQIWVAGVR
jgi:hypothetical protein